MIPFFHNYLSRAEIEIVMTYVVHRLMLISYRRSWSYGEIIRIEFFGVIKFLDKIDDCALTFVNLTENQKTKKWPLTNIVRKDIQPFE